MPATNPDISQLVRDGQLAEALEEAKQNVRSKPDSPQDRWLLFDLLLHHGKWESAHGQLSVLRDLVKDDAPYMLLLDSLLMGEQVREGVFAGRSAPHFLGQPPAWAGRMVEALRLEKDCHYEAANRLRQQALEEATAFPGHLNEDTPFAWLGDADTRIGPLFEAFINGSYLWVPQDCVQLVAFEEPSTLRDLFWCKAIFKLTNGGSTAGFIPVSYCGTAQNGDDAQRLARRTDWIEQPGKAWHGRGQRLFTTDNDEHPFLGLRSITFAHGD